VYIADKFQGPPLIITQHVYPPIPLRCFDWCAYLDPESRLVGWGKTREAAITDLLTMLDEKL